MSVVDKIKEAVGLTPNYSDEERRQIRQEARNKAKGRSWFTMVLDHHDQLDKAFAAVDAASTVAARTEAEQKLALLLTGHSLAEEAALYPALSVTGHSARSTHAFQEQSLAKTMLFKLDGIKAKMGKEYRDEFDKLRLAVAAHMVEEEKDFFPTLMDDATADQNARMTEKFVEEYERYSGLKA